MLTWTERADGWYANGYRIELAGPFRWLLLDANRSHDVGAVRLEEHPLAVARSFTECKREAELLEARRRKHLQQRQHIILLLLILGATPLALGASSFGNGMIVVLAIALATRSVMFLLGSVLPRAFGEQHQVFYQ